MESTHRSRLSDLLPPQVGLMASPSCSLRDLSILFVATILDAKGFIDQLEAAFCHELWPAICELENSRCRITELEKCVDVNNKEREERQQLDLLREDERTRLLAENGSLRMELEQLVKKGPSVEAEIQILQSKVQTLVEQNVNVEKQRQSLASEVEQLQMEVKLSTTKELLLKAENQKLAMKRPQSVKSEALHNRRRTESPSSLVAGKDVEPVISEDPQYLKENPPVQSAFILPDVDQGVHFPVSSLETKKPMRERRPLEREVNRAAVVVPLHSPRTDSMCQGEAAKDSQDIDAEHIFCTQRPNAKCDAESRPCPPALFVDSDETVMDVVQEVPTSSGIVQEYPIVSISSETEAEPCDELLLILPGRVNDAMQHGATVQEKLEDTGAVCKAGPLISISPNLPNLRPPPRTKVGNKPVQGTKERPWRQTRHRTEPCDIDPHDSFLDTPRERILAQLEEDRKAQSIAVPRVSGVPIINKLECRSVEEPREGHNGARKQDRPSASLRLVVEASKNGRPDRKEIKAPASKAPPVKFNEPVRKKRDREMLQATDCKQCKAFYDAVAAGDASGMLANKCEHQDAVSRHRFKYLPPPTPEGFWNIGFDDSVK
ncbi:unnamed protein product [Calypogeia fissa]